MKTKTKILIALGLLLLIIGTAYAMDLKETNDVKIKGDHLEIDGKQVAEIKEYSSSDCIDSEILSKDSAPIIKMIDDSGAKEVSSVSNPKGVYEFLTNDGMYYSFAKGDKFYIVSIDQSNWKGTMLKEMDEWCLLNSK